MNTIKYMIFVSLLFLMIPIPAAHSNSNCEGISPNSKVYWDGIELKKGQIGRVTVDSKTTLYKLENNTYTAVRQMDKGERYRVYTLRSGYYGVGGGLVVKKEAPVIYQTPSKSKLHLISCSEVASDSYALFDSKVQITNTLGQPKSNLINEFKLTTSAYHNSYKNLNMISYINNQAHLIYSKDINFKYKNLKIGDSVNTVINQLGPDYETIGSTYNDEVLLYTFNDHQVYIFIDYHKDKKISGFYLISNKMIDRNSTLFPTKSLELQKSYESQMFIVINAERKLNNINAVNYSNNASLVAREHSKDMAVNDYFSHTNLKGLSPFDRLAIAGIDYRTAGENIAMGFTNPYFAHEALMNSIGHRKNLLNPNYSNLGVGIDFQSWNTGSTPYYAENYFTP
ncbi:CAP domain-containing protein [Paenisporosarcina sp. NPDC076898]|uniref:CAP domain-containing protein n=1 Tax=unclassified Paenisporosarcina TaxID=2642018 RepID=UPI003D017DDB